MCDAPKTNAQIALECAVALAKTSAERGLGFDWSFKANDMLKWLNANTPKPTNLSK